MASDICPPFPHATVDAMHAGDLILDLPGIYRQSLSIASSHDASIVAVGIPLLDSDERGMVRVYAWSCQHSNFLLIGQDLFGSSNFDGYGVSVDNSSDGMVLCVGQRTPSWSWRLRRSL